MKNVVVIYDDTVPVVGRAKSILGKKSYGSMVLKRRSMFTRLKDALSACSSSPKIIRVTDKDSFNELVKQSVDAVYVHILSNSAIVDDNELATSIDKAQYAVKTTIFGGNNRSFGFIFPSLKSYSTFLGKYCDSGNFDFVDGDVFDAPIFVDISNYEALLMYISGGFDARYFNSLSGDNYMVTKRSADKKKMESEYKYYWLLPEKMRSFMVMPYDFKDEGDTACYTMERMPMTDIAIRWTHGAVDLDELEAILDKSFYFINSRDSQAIEKEEYRARADKLYLEKLDDRIKKLKELPEYAPIAEMIKAGTKYNTIDEIVAEYKDLYEKAIKRVLKSKKTMSVIGHGDMFFANMLYSKEVNLLRLIDPKGALKESDLWTDPYYDIAKLSHSICGNYDFFNTASYDIVLEKDMQYALHVHTDNRKAKELFKHYLEKNGFDYVAVRVFESSLFLSMLPLHIDNPHKVFGFILNAINIMEDVKNV